MANEQVEETKASDYEKVVALARRLEGAELPLEDPLLTANNQQRRPRRPTADN